MCFSLYIYTFSVMALTVCSQHSNIRKDEVPEEPENKTLDATGMLLWKWGWGCSCRGSGRCLEQQQHLRRRAWASSCDRLNEHLTVCVCVWDSVLYVSQWIVFNVARLKLPAWTSFSASPLYFFIFFKPLFIHRGSSERSAVFLQEQVISPRSQQHILTE